jgi:hypothetical protein
MTTATIDLAGLFATTLPKINPKVTYDILRAHPLMLHMLRGGAFTVENGGSEIRCPVVLEDSVNTGAVAKYESFGITPEDTLDSARYQGWPKYRGSWTLDQTEVDENSGPQKVIDLAEAKQNQTLHTFNAGVSADLMGDGTSLPAKRLKGIETFIEFATEAQQAINARTPGGLPKATYANWRNKYGQITRFGVDGIEVMNTTYRACSSQGLHPDIGIADDVVYGFLEKELAPKQSLFDKDMADFGYANVMFKEMPLVYDRDNLTGTGKIFFLTTTGRTVKGGIKPEMFTLPGLNGMPKNQGMGYGFQLHFLRQSTKTILRIDKPQKPVNQDALVVNMYMNPLLSCSSIKRQGAIDFSGSVIY